MTILHRGISTTVSAALSLIVISLILNGNLLLVKCGEVAKKQHAKKSSQSGIDLAGSNSRNFPFFDAFNPMPMSEAANPGKIAQEFFHTSGKIASDNMHVPGIPSMDSIPGMPSFIPGQKATEEKNSNKKQKTSAVKSKPVAVSTPSDAISSNKVMIKATDTSLQGRAAKPQKKYSGAHKQRLRKLGRVANEDEEEAQATDNPNASGVKKSSGVSSKNGTVISKG